MSKQEIREILAELKAESGKIHSSDIDVIEYINLLIEKLEHILTEPDVQDDQTLIEHTQKVIDRFEASHPRLVAVVNDLMVKLAGLGV